MFVSNIFCCLHHLLAIWNLQPEAGRAIATAQHFCRSAIATPERVYYLCCSLTMPRSHSRAIFFSFCLNIRLGRVRFQMIAVIHAGMTGMLQKLVSNRRASGHGMQDNMSPAPSQDLSWVSTGVSGPGAQNDRNWQALRGFQRIEGASSLLWNQPDRPPDIPKRVSQTSSGGCEHLACVPNHAIIILDVSYLATVRYLATSKN